MRGGFMYSQRFKGYYPYYYQNNDRIGFIGPFILGGIAGGLAAPLFYNNNNNCYGNNCIPYNTYYNYFIPYYHR